MTQLENPAPDDRLLSALKFGQATAEPEISVIVPAFQPADFVELQASMAANSNASAEWIIVDDGSGAQFDAIFDKLRGTAARVIRQPENRRQGAARNAGLAEARGDWIKFLDADDRLDAGHLQTLLTAAQGAFGGTIPFAPTRHILPGGRSWVNDSWHDLPLDPEAQLARLLHRPFLHHGGALFPRRLLVCVGGYEESLMTDEDGDLLARLLMLGAHFMAVPEVEYHYIHHRGAGRVSSDKGSDKLAARLRVCERVEAAFAARNEEMPEAVCRAIALRLDKIATAWWNGDRMAAKAILARARQLCPDYQNQNRLPMRVLRALGGPGVQIKIAQLYRRLRGRPPGGAQA